MSETAFLARTLKPFSLDKRYVQIAHIHDSDYSDYDSSDPDEIPAFDSTTNILRLDVHCKNEDVKRRFFRDIYSMYDYGYVNHPPYDPTAALMVTKDHNERDVDDIIEQYLGRAEHGVDITQPKPPPLCPCCRSVNKHNAKHNRKSYQPSPRPYIQDSLPNVLKLPQIQDAPTPRVKPKAVRFEEDVYVHSYTPEQIELQSESQVLPVHGEGNDRRGFYVTKPQMINFFSEFGMDERTPVSKKTDDILTASVKYNDAMDRLGNKVKMFEK